MLLRPENRGVVVECQSQQPHTGRIFVQVLGSNAQPGHLYGAMDQDPRVLGCLRSHGLEQGLSDSPIPVVDSIPYTVDEFPRGNGASRGIFRRHIHQADRQPPGLPLGMILQLPWEYRREAAFLLATSATFVVWSGLLDWA